MAKKDYLDIMVIGDPHAHPEWDNERFTALASFVKEVAPDVVVCMGDFADMPSLSAYEKKTLASEGRRYVDDIAAANDALSRLKLPAKTKAFVTLGNHEDRIDRAANADPALYGTISTKDILFKEHGWEVIPYKEALLLNGWHFSHFVPGGVKGDPVGGDNVAASVLNKEHTSFVVGHGHTLDFAERAGRYGQHITAISAGCYAHQNFVEGWCRNTEFKWWRGVVVIQGAVNGQYSALHLARQSVIMSKP